MRITKKAVSLVLAMLMITSLFTIVPMTASAAPPTDTGSGTGTGGSTAVINPTTAGDYLTFTAEEAGSTVTLNVRYGSNLKYNKNDSGWASYSPGTAITLNNVGDYVRFSGKDTEFNDTKHVSLTGKVACSGSVMSLRLNDGEVQGLSNYCFQYMFYNCTGLTTAPELPETTLARYCYAAMFGGCTSLTKAPNLPATNLADHCYSYMFRGCGNLTELPALPATTLADQCYGYMFYDCSNIRISNQAGTFNGITYSAEYRIPTTGTGTVTPGDDPLDDMFSNTGGKFTGTPNINTTYYLPAPATPKVAEVNGTQYDTLEEALAAAPSGATVKLLEDIDFSEVTTNRNAHDTGNEVKVDLKNLTLDMDGHTITTVNASVVFTGNGATIENGNFALKHVKADGTTYQAGSYGLCIDGYGVENGITLNDLTVEGGINIWDADVEINTTTATATASNFYAIWAEGDSNVVVNSGTFSDNGTSGARGPVATDADGTETLVTIKGGTFNATNKVVNNAAPGSVKFEGGTATKPVLEQYCGDGYIPENNGDGTYGVKVGTYVAQVGSTKYETLEEALAAAKTAETKTVVLTNDCTDQFVLEDFNDTVTLDLNGYTLTGAYEDEQNEYERAAVYVKNASLVIKDSSEAKTGCITTNDTNQSYAVVANNGGSIDFESGKIDAKRTGIYAYNNSTVNFFDGTIINRYSTSYDIMATVSSSVNIYDGDFTSYSWGNVFSYNNSEVKVYGGRYTVTNKGQNWFHLNAVIGSNSTIELMGGSFEKVVDEYCADGYATQPAGNNRYNVVPVDTTNPLNPINKLSSSINDNNAFGIKTDYLMGTLIGVQNKAVVPYSTSSQEGAKNMRFIAVLDTDLVNDAEDYGFVVAKLNETKDYSNTKIENLKAFWGNGEKTLSAKNTKNNVCGTSAYGDPTDDTTDYKYITCAINDVSDSDKFIVRFYVKINGKYYYAKYSGHDYKYTGCIASWADCLG